MSNFVNLTCKKATIMCFIRNQGKQPKFYKKIYTMWADVKH